MPASASDAPITFRNPRRLTASTHSPACRGNSSSSIWRKPGFAASSSRPLPVTLARLAGELRLHLGQRHLSPARWTSPLALPHSRVRCSPCSRRFRSSLSSSVTYLPSSVACLAAGQLVRWTDVILLRQEVAQVRLAGELFIVRGHRQSALRRIAHRHAFAIARHRLQLRP